MPNNIRGAAPTPDTSPANVARVLREASQYARVAATALAYPARGTDHPVNADARDASLRAVERFAALADALDALTAPMPLRSPFRPAVGTWAERVERAELAWAASEPLRNPERPWKLTPDRLNAALRAAFPEMAP